MSAILLLDVSTRPFLPGKTFASRKKKECFYPGVCNMEYAVRHRRFDNPECNPGFVAGSVS